MSIKTLIKSIFFLFLFQSAICQVIPPAEPIEEEEEKKEESTEKNLATFEKPKPAWRSNMRYGGNIGLGFFGAFYVDASPMIGYDVTGKNTVVGVGGSFIFQGQYRGTGAMAYGGRVFVRQAIWRMVFAQAEYEYMNANRLQFYGEPPTAVGQKWGGSPLIGLGIYRSGGNQQKGGFISIMYNTGAPNKGFISPQSLGGRTSGLSLRYGFLF